MPVTYSIDPALKALRITAFGEVTLHEEVANFRACVEDPGYRVGMSFLIDYRERSSAPSTAYVKDMVARASANEEHLGGARCAVVVARQADFGMARMFSLLTDNSPLEVGVFWDIKKAESWLAWGTHADEVRAN